MICIVVSQAGQNVTLKKKGLAILFTVQEYVHEIKNGHAKTSTNFQKTQVFHV